MTPGPFALRDATKRSQLLMALHEAEKQQGYLSSEAMESVAEDLGISLREVYEAESFYTMYKTQPMGRYVIQVCEGLSCHLTGGADRLVNHLQKKLGIQAGETTDDGMFSLQTVQCLAVCDLSPAMLINDTLYGNLTFDRVDSILQELRGE